MATRNMIFAGFGGQGVLFTGKVVAYAGVLEGKEVSWMPSYGPEMRGGTANCSVCVSDDPIGSPLVNEPDILLVMNGPSFDKFINAVRPGGLVIMDSSLIDREIPRDDVTIVKVPATRLSNDEGLKGGANMIMMGKMLAESKFTEMETLEASLKKSAPGKVHLLADNLRAINLGFNYSE